MVTCQKKCQVQSKNYHGGLYILLSYLSFFSKIMDESLIFAIKKTGWKFNFCSVKFRIFFYLKTNWELK